MTETASYSNGMPKHSSDTATRRDEQRVNPTCGLISFSLKMVFSEKQHRVRRDYLYTLALTPQSQKNETRAFLLSMCANGSYTFSFIAFTKLTLIDKIR
jgi:hypothetical protein